MSKRPRKRPMPKALKEVAAKAMKRHSKRYAAPAIAIGVQAAPNDWLYQSPYRKADDDDWRAILYDGLATRSPLVAHTFIDHLADLCSSDFDVETRRHTPNAEELSTAIEMVASVNPRNAMQAAQAAQQVALYFASMKLGKEIGSRAYPDARTINSLAAVCKASAALSDSLHKQNGRRKTARQVIKVEKHVTYNDNRRVTVPGEGGGVGGEPQTTSHELRARDPDSSGPLIDAEVVQPSSRAALPSPLAVGESLPIRRDEGEAGVSNARGKESGSAKG